MKRNIIAVICLMLAFSFIFVSCSKNVYYVDNKGVSHIAYTNDNGETVTDKSGNVLVVPTDDEGNVITDEFGHYEPQTVSDQGVNVDENGKGAEAAAYKLTAPKGWEIRNDISSYVQIRPLDENNKTKVDIQYNDQGYDATVEAMVELKKNFVEAAKEVYIDSKEEVTLKDGEITPATKITFLGLAEKNGEEIVSGYICYIFSHGKYTYNVFCIINSEDDAKHNDFEKIIDAIEFK